MNKSGIRGDNDYEVIGLLCLRFDFITFVNCSYSVSKNFTRSDEVFGSVRVPSEGSRY